MATIGCDTGKLFHAWRGQRDCDAHAANSNSGQKESIFEIRNYRLPLDLNRIDTLSTENYAPRECVSLDCHTALTVKPSKGAPENDERQTCPLDIGKARVTVPVVTISPAEI